MRTLVYNILYPARVGASHFTGDDRTLIEGVPVSALQLLFLPQCILKISIDFFILLVQSLSSLGLYFQIHLEFLCKFSFVLGPFPSFPKFSQWRSSVLMGFSITSD